MRLLLRKKWRWLGAAFAGITLVGLFFIDPTSVRWFPPCIFHKLTGFDCPGCGSSRGLHSLLHGDLRQAADYNLLLFLALPMLFSGFYYRLTGRGEAVWQRLNKPRTLLCIVVLFWLLRNIPGHSLSWLGAGR